MKLAPVDVPVEVSAAVVGTGAAVVAVVELVVAVADEVVAGASVAAALVVAESLPAGCSPVQAGMAHNSGSARRLEP